VKFATSMNGTAMELFKGDDGSIVIGVKTEDGKEWLVKKIILDTGSYSDSFLDFEGQLVAACACTINPFHFHIKSSV
jgi:hypothetical protein